MTYDYHLVDVFTQRALEGNALAVFTDATGMTDETMQAIAREMNLSETSFILPEASAPSHTRVRIFTPTYEMTFAGHPTIGTAYVMRRQGLVEPHVRTLTLAENVGRVEVRIDEGDDPRIWLTTPPIATVRRFDPADCARALTLQPDDLITGIPCELLSAGNPCIFVPLRDPATVDRAEVDANAYRDLVASREQTTCLFPFAPVARGAYARMFSPELGIVEDPATGSATGPLAAFMMRYGLVRSEDGTTFVSEQGTKMRRRSLLHVRIRGDGGSAGIDVGGHVTYVAHGRLTL
jgi:trans-2,3-dihydro-3-hydroxyanthranilate isomerase